jgi:hypothetical protein
MSKHNFEYRDYQVEGRHATFREHEAGDDSACFVLPTSQDDPRPFGEASGPRS